MAGMCTIPGRAGSIGVSNFPASMLHNCQWLDEGFVVFPLSITAAQCNFWWITRVWLNWWTTMNVCLNFRAITLARWNYWTLTQTWWSFLTIPRPEWNFWTITQTQWNIEAIRVLDETNFNYEIFISLYIKIIKHSLSGLVWNQCYQTPQIGGTCLEDENPFDFSDLNTSFKITISSYLIEWF